MIFLMKLTYTSNNDTDKRYFSWCYASLWPRQLGKSYPVQLPQSLPAWFLTSVVNCAIPSSKQPEILLPFSKGAPNQALLHSLSCVTSLLDRCVTACLGVSTRTKQSKGQRLTVSAKQGLQGCVSIRSLVTPHSERSAYYVYLAICHTIQKCTVGYSPTGSTFIVLGRGQI